MKTSQKENDREALNRMLFGIFVTSGISYAISSLLPTKQFEYLTRIIILWCVIGIVINIGSRVLITYIKLASFYYLQTFIAMLPVAGVLIDISTRAFIMFTKIHDKNVVIYIALTILGLLLGSWGQYRSIQMQLKNSKKHNIESGRLDIDNNFWNMEKTLYLDTPKKQYMKNRLYNNILKLSPIMTASGILVARMMTENIQTISVILCGYLLGYIYLLAFTSYLGIAIQIFHWDNEYGTRFKIK